MSQSPLDERWQIDALCDWFEARWKSGERPRIEELLEQIPPSARGELLREALRVELEYRHWLSEQPTAEEYRTRFSDAVAVVEDVFDQFQRSADESASTPGVLSPDSLTATSPTAMPAPAALLADPQFGSDYELLEQLGKGGMGVVYRARQRSTDRIVALKVIRPDRMLGLPEEERRHAIERFRNEAQAAARLDHDHIVTIYEVGEAGGQPYYAMRYVDGPCLADLLQSHPLEDRVAARYLEQAARAVDAAHRAGVLHRDLKPRNLLLDTRQDRVLVTDFGVAKLCGDGPQITLSGEIFGSPSYMAPEQAEDSGRVTVAADVYGLGATLYHLLTGRPPIYAPTVAATMHQILTQEPVSPRQLNVVIDRDVETICQKCLDKDPARRYASAGDLAADLGRYLNHQPILARPLGVAGRTARWCRRNPWIAAMSAAVTILLLVAVTAGAIAYCARVEAGQRQIALNEHAAVLRVKDVWQLRKERPVGWTWKGLELLAEAKALGVGSFSDAELRTEAIACLTSVDLRKVAEHPEAPRCHGVAFSPDGRWLAAVQGRAGMDLRPCNVTLIDRGGGPSRTLGFPSRGVGPQSSGQDGGRAVGFSPDGRWLVVGTHTGWLIRWDLTTEPSEGIGWNAHKQDVSGLAFSRDLTSCYSWAEDGCVVRWDVPAGWKEAARETSSAPAYAALDPNGPYLVRAGDGMHRLDARTLRPLLELATDRYGMVRWVGRTPSVAAVSRHQVALLETKQGNQWAAIDDPQTPAQDALGIESLDVHPEGMLVVSGGTDGRLRVWNPSQCMPLASVPLGGDTTPRPVFSPDGRYIATPHDAGVLVYEVRSVECRSTVALQRHVIQGVGVSEDGRHIATVGWHCRRGFGEVGVWDFTDGQQIASFATEWRLPPERNLRNVSAALHPLHPWAAFTGVDGGFLVLDWKRGASLPLPDRPLRLSAAIAHDGSLWAISGNGDTLAAWDVPGMKLRGQWSNAAARMLTDKSQITCFALGHKTAVAGCPNGSVAILNLDTIACGSGWSSGLGPVQAVAISADDRWTAIGNTPGALRVLRTADCSVTASFELGDRIGVLAFSPDGTFLAAGTDNGRLGLWQIRGEEFLPLGNLTEGGYPIRAVQFTADNRLVSLSHDEHSVHVWHLDRIRERLVELELGW